MRYSKFFNSYARSLFGYSPESGRVRMRFLKEKFDCLASPYGDRTEVDSVNLPVVLVDSIFGVSEENRFTKIKRVLESQEVGGRTNKTFWNYLNWAFAEPKTAVDYILLGTDGVQCISGGDGLLWFGTDVRQARGDFTRIDKTIIWEVSEWLGRMRVYEAQAAFMKKNGLRDFAEIPNAEMRKIGAEAAYGNVVKEMLTVS